MAGRICVIPSAPTTSSRVWFACEMAVERSTCPAWWNCGNADVLVRVHAAGVNVLDSKIRDVVDIRPMAADDRVARSHADPEIAFPVRSPL